MAFACSGVNLTLDAPDPIRAQRQPALMAHQRMMPALVGRRSDSGAPVAAVIALIVLGAAFSGLGSLDVIAPFFSRMLDLKR